MGDRHIRLSIVTSADGRHCDIMCEGFEYDSDDCKRFGVLPFDLTRHRACIDAERLAKQDSALEGGERFHAAAAEREVTELRARIAEYTEALADVRREAQDAIAERQAAGVTAIRAKREVTELQALLAAGRGLREDAEAKLSRLGAHARRQNDSLRAERTALRKGQSTVAMRITEVTRERDAALEREARLRGKLDRVRAACSAGHDAAYDLAGDVLAIIEEGSEG